MKKNEFIMAIIAVVLLILFGISFIVDSNERVIKRTVDLELSDTMEIVEMEKRGFVFSRSSYTAKIKIDMDTDVDVLINALSSSYNVGGDILPYDDFVEFKKEVLDSEKITPVPTLNTNVYVVGVKDVHNSTVVFIMDTEGDDEAFLYIYYAK